MPIEKENPAREGCGGARGIDLAWRCVHEIGAALHAELTTATVGNHDIDSRHQANKYDPKGFLMRLTPQYPLQDGSLCDRFWARNYAIVEKTDYRLVILNTCAFHGYGKEDVIQGKPHKELDHGRVSEYTIDALHRELDSLPHKDINILLCHH